jgi:hypothetical protein
MSATQNGPNIRYVRPIDYPWAFSALHTTLDVIGAKLEVRDDLLVATILSFSTTICWSRSAFGPFGNPSSTPDICRCLLGICNWIYVRS